MFTILSHITHHTYFHHTFAILSHITHHTYFHHTFTILSHITHTFTILSPYFHTSHILSPYFRHTFTHHTLHITHVHMRIHTHTHITSIFTYTHTDRYTYTRANTRTQTHAHIHVHTHTCTYTYVPYFAGINQRPVQEVTQKRAVQSKSLTPTGNLIERWVSCTVKGKHLCTQKKSTCAYYSHIYTVYDRIFGDFPAKNTVYTPYIYGSGQPYILAKCSFMLRFA